MQFRPPPKKNQQTSALHIHAHNIIEQCAAVRVGPEEYNRGMP